MARREASRVRARLWRMLESFSCRGRCWSGESERLTARLGALGGSFSFRLRFRTARRFGRTDRSAENALWQISHGRAFELSRGPTGAFFPTVNRIAKHLRDRFAAAQEMHLEAVRLLFGPRFRIDPADVCFRIWISSFFHTLSPNERNLGKK